MKLPSCPRTLIIGILRKNPDGLTITSIAELACMHRHTATKYVYELKGAGVINERDVGSAKLCYLREGLSKEDEKKVVSRLNGNGVWRKSSSSIGQVQILTAFLFLFLVPATIIIAQNATQSMNSTGQFVLDQLNMTPEAFGEANATIPEMINMSAILESNATLIANETNETTSAENQTLVPEENQTIQEDNVTTVESPTEPLIFLNETQENLAIPNETVANETIQNEMNATVILPESQTLPETGEANATIPEVLQPILTVRIISPEKSLRGEQFDISAAVSNAGNSEAKNVRLEWILPEGLEIVSGQNPADCWTISPDSECMSSLTVSAPISADIGKSEIKVIVGYEE